jgi:hypothetical protein
MALLLLVTNAFWFVEIIVLVCHVRDDQVPHVLTSTISIYDLGELRILLKILIYCHSMMQKNDGPQVL